MKRLWGVFFVVMIVFVQGCTEEARNKFFRQADNIIGQDLKVTYIDNGKVIKTWTIRDSKITTGKDEQGQNLGYYYFWSEETGYVQLPIERTIIEEIKNNKSE